MQTFHNWKCFNVAVTGFMLLHYGCAVMQLYANIGYRWYCLFRPPGPALAGRLGLYIFLLYFLYFFARTYRRESAIQAAAVTAPTVEPPAVLIRYPDIWHILPPFWRGSKMCQILAQISTPVVFGPPYFWTGALYRKRKTDLSRTDDSSTIIPNVGWVGPPTPRTVSAMVTPKGKSG